MNLSVQGYIFKLDNDVVNKFSYLKLLRKNVYEGTQHDTDQYGNIIENNIDPIIFSKIIEMAREDKFDLSEEIEETIDFLGYSGKKLKNTLFQVNMHNVEFQLWDRFEVNSYIYDNKEDASIKLMEIVIEPLKSILAPIIDQSIEHKTNFPVNVANKFREYFDVRKLIRYMDNLIQNHSYGDAISKSAEYIAKNIKKMDEYNFSFDDDTDSIIRYNFWIKKIEVNNNELHINDHHENDLETTIK
jgi:hypothetical protein